MDPGLRKLPSHFNRDLKFPLNFRVDSRFTYNPNFAWIPPPPTTIPWDSAQNPREFAGWVHSGQAVPIT